MPNNRSVLTDDKTADRDRTDLKEALSEVTQAKSHLAELERGQEKARTKSWDISSQVEEAQQALTRLRQQEPKRAALAFAQDDMDDVASPVPTAEFKLTKLRQELERIRSVESALAAEIPKAQSRLRDAERSRYIALAEFLVAAPKYDKLCQAHTSAWQRLRTVRAALAQAHAACKGQVPTAYFEAAQRSENLSSSVVGASIDQAFVDAWTQAMAALEIDPDAKLPT
jgi:chromosome segregation ATPase